MLCFLNFLLWVEFLPLNNAYVESLNPSTLECATFGDKALKELTKLK